MMALRSGYKCILVGLAIFAMLTCAFAPSNARAQTSRHYVDVYTYGTLSGYIGGENNNITIIIENIKTDDPDYADNILWGLNVTIVAMKNETGYDMLSQIITFDYSKTQFIDMLNPYGQAPVQFQFDIMDNAPKGRYNFSLKIEYNYTSATGVISQYTELLNSIQFDIRSYAYITDLKVSGYSESGILRNSGMLYAGDNFIKTRLKVRNNNSADDITGMTVQFTNLPAGFSMDSTSASMPSADSISYYEEYTFEFRTNVDRMTSPGMHWTVVRLTYMLEDQMITEDNLKVYFMVDYTPIMQATSLSPNTLSQGTMNQAFEVSVTNVGNVRLTRLTVWLELGNYSTTNPFFGTGKYYYDGSGYKRIESPTATIDSLAPGASTTVVITLDIMKLLPPGEHRLQFLYWGMYEDRGETGSTVGFKTIPWSTHNAVYGINPYAKLIITDSKVDMRAKQYTTVSLGGQVKDISFGVDLYNDEYVAYQNVMAKMTIGGNTPFVNRVDPSLSEVSLDSQFDLARTTNTRIYFRVDLNPSAQPGVYNMSLTITGKNADTKEDINEIIPLEVTLRPRIPNVVITKVSYGAISSGNNFKVQVTIQNRGGDSLRNTLITIGDYSSTSIPTTESTDPTYAAYAGSAINPFSPVIGAVVINELEPDGTTVLNFTLACDSNYVPGKAYQKAITLSYYDSFGTYYSKSLPFAIQSKASTAAAEKPFSATTLPGMIGFYAVLITLSWGLIIVGLFLAKKLFGGRPFGKGKREDQGEVTVVMPPQSAQAVSRPPMNLQNMGTQTMNPQMSRPVAAPFETPMNPPINQQMNPPVNQQMNPPINQQMNTPTNQPMPPMMGAQTTSQPQMGGQQLVQQMPPPQAPQGSKPAGKFRICQFCGKEMGKLPEGYKVCPHCKTPFT